MVSALYSTSDCCPDFADLTLGADAACYNLVFPQYATETDRRCIRGTRLVSSLPCVVLAASHKTDCMVSRTTRSWTYSLSEGFQLVLIFIVSESSFIPKRSALWCVEWMQLWCLYPFGLLFILKLPACLCSMLASIWFHCWCLCFELVTAWTVVPQSLRQWSEWTPVNFIYNFQLSCL